VVAQPRAPPPLVAGRPVDAIAPVALDQEITVAGEVFRLSATGGSAAHQGGGGSGCAGAGDSVVRP
jgi:hypothetical protein